MGRMQLERFGEAHPGPANHPHEVPAGTHVPSCDGARFVCVAIGALACGGLALSVMHLTMGWMPNAGPMLAFSAFAGTVLGTFIGALFGVVFLEPTAEERESASDLDPRFVLAEVPLEAEEEVESPAGPTSGIRPLRSFVDHPSWEQPCDAERRDAEGHDAEGHDAEGHDAEAA